ncbi:MAG: 50S ribosomal protein L28, partial [Actinobacteria bacterium]
MPGTRTGPIGPGTARIRCQSGPRGCFGHVPERQLRGGGALAVGYPGRLMSKVCAVCGKKPGFGNHRSHSMVASKRR